MAATSALRAARPKTRLYEERIETDQLAQARAARVRAEDPPL